MNEEENENSREVSLLDLLVAIAENWKLLLLGPLIIGLIALGIGFVLPQGFTSQAILVFPTSSLTPTAAQAGTMMVSPLVLDPVVQSLNLAGGRPLQRARAELASQISASVGKDGLLRLDVTANTPTAAQTIANAVIDTWLKTTLPGERDREDLVKRLAYATASLKSVGSLLERLTAEGAARLSKTLTRGDAGISIVAVGELQTRYLAEVLNTSRALKGLSRDIVMQPPTVPTESATPRKGLMAVLAAVGSGIVLLLWVFARQAWKNAAQDPESAEKQAKLRATLGLKVSPH